MNDQNNHTKKANAYLKYSGLAFQLVFLIGLGLWLGTYLDKKLGFITPICTMSLIIVFFGAYMYKLYINLMQK